MITAATPRKPVNDRISAAMMTPLALADRIRQTKIMVEVGPRRDA
jgi:hypothetical protein